MARFEFSSETADPLELLGKFAAPVTAEIVAANVNGGTWRRIALSIDGADDF
jgi:hypothetical protein